MISQGIPFTAVKYVYFAWRFLTENYKFYYQKNTTLFTAKLIQHIWNKHFASKTANVLSPSFQKITDYSRITDSHYIYFVPRVVWQCRKVKNGPENEVCFALFFIQGKTVLNAKITICTLLLPRVSLKRGRKKTQVV